MIYYSSIAPFYHVRAKERVKYATLLPCRTRQKYGLKAEPQNGRTKLYFVSGIINPLFDGLKYNTTGHFAHCSYFYEYYFYIRAYYMLKHRIRCMYCIFFISLQPMWSRDSAVVRAFASHKSHQCGPGSIPGPAVICRLSLFLVLVPAPRVFLRALRFSSLHKNQHF